MSDHDVAVIGGGAAGLSAALVLSRARRRVVVDAGAPHNAPATHLHGFLSRDGLPPRALLDLGRGPRGGGVNVVDPRAQVMTAAGAGSAAAIAINGDLVEDDIRIAQKRLTS